MNENNYDSSERKVVNLSIDDVLPNRFQPRIKFEDSAIFELSESIKAHGVFQPIIVRPIGDKYEIIAGERRYKASVLANKKTIPAIIMNLNDKDTIEIALIENVQRANLTPIEEAISYKKILDMGYMNQEKLAEKLGKTQSTIANKLRLLNLDEDVQEALLENKISERHARSLLKLKDYNQQKLMLKRIINERLTVRKTDEEIEKMFNEEKKENINPIKIDQNSANNVSEVVEDVPIDNGIFGNNQQFFTNEISHSQPLNPFSNIPTSDSSVSPTQESSIKTESVENLLKSNEIQQEEQKPVNEMMRTGKFFDFVPSNDVPSSQENIEEMKNIEAEKNFNFDSLYSNVVNNDNNPKNTNNYVSSQVVSQAETPSESSTPFGFGTPVEAPAESSTPFGYGAPIEAPTELSTPFGFGAPLEAPAESSTPFGYDAPIETPTESSTSFEFGAPVEAPAKSSTPFGFGTPVEAPAESSTPFGYGAPVEAPTQLKNNDKPLDTSIPEIKDEKLISDINVTNNEKNVMQAVEVIREAQAKIESMGFVVNIDEFDLENMYQLIIKIDK